MNSSIATSRLAALLPARLRQRGVYEFLKFCVVGGSGVGVNLGVYVIATRWCGLTPQLASPIAIEISLLGNFLANELWTFRDRALRSSWPQRLLTYHAVCLAGGAINYGVLLWLVAQGWWDITANLLGIALGVGAKFVASAGWTWREHRDP
jgi:putative flippase GtrA